MLPCGIKLYVAYGNSPEILTQVIQRKPVPPGRKFELTPKLKLITNASYTNFLNDTDTRPFFAHDSSWTTQQNFSLKVLMDIAHNENISRFLDALNPEIANTVIVPDQPDTLLRVKESLDAGFLIGTLGDRISSDVLVFELKDFATSPRCAALIGGRRPTQVAAGGNSGR